MPVKSVVALAVLAALPSVAQAQSAAAVLEARSPIAVMLDETVSSEGFRAGKAFHIVVARDVMVGRTTVIPRGTPGVGEVVWRRDNGGFGKSGKLSIAVRSLDVAGQRVPLTGTFLQAGQGRPGATVAMGIWAGVAGAALVRGEDAVFERGRELTAYTVEPFFSQARPAVLTAAYRAPARVPVSPMRLVPALSPAFADTLAAAQPIRRSAKLGWTISD